MNKYIGQVGVMQAAEGVPMVQTLRERLKEQKKIIELHLMNINSALEFIDKNQEFENFHNIVGKVGY